MANGFKSLASLFQRFPLAYRPIIIWLRLLGCRAASYEIKDDEVYQNLLHPLGLCFALSLCIRLHSSAPWWSDDRVFGLISLRHLKARVYETKIRSGLEATTPLTRSVWPGMVGAGMQFMGVDQPATWTIWGRA